MTAGKDAKCDSLANGYEITAGSLNNRAEKRDDGLRQDRHPDRTRGESSQRQPRIKWTDADTMQNPASTVTADVAVALGEAEAPEVVAPAPRVTTVTATLASGTYKRLQTSLHGTNTSSQRAREAGRQGLGR